MKGFATEHPCDLGKRIGGLLLDSKTSDMTLIVEGERLPAHRLIIASACDYFRALLQGNMKESFQDEIVLENVPLRGFKILMEYIYSGQVRLGELDENAILELLRVVHLYGFEALQATLCSHLKRILSMKNVCQIYCEAIHLQLDKLSDACHRLLIAKPDAILKSEFFCELSEATLCRTLSQDTFCAEEIEIFKAVQLWCSKRPAGEDSSNVLRCIRLPLIEIKDLVTTVKDSGLISTELLMDVIRTKECRLGEMNVRGTLRAEVNVAYQDRGAKELQEHARGDIVVNSEKILAYKSKPLAFRLTVHPSGLLVALSELFFINHISFRFHEQHFECPYYVEVSVNLETWVKIIDHTTYACSYLQDLYFEPRVVRYIRVVDARSSNRGELLKLSALVVDYVKKPLKLSNGFPVPEKNIASASLGATITQSHQGSFGLIKGGSPFPDDSQWTSHEIGNGSITIKLPQPYVVDSMRMLLKSDKSRGYKYYIETSVDQKNWTKVVERTTEFCRSWQDIAFEARPVLYIRIMGTASKVGKRFICACFECPAAKRSGPEVSGQEDDIDNGAVKRQRLA